MILIPKLLNLYSKDRPSWQERYDRRLRLLRFVGPMFWNQPEDFELLVAAHGPNIMKSVSSFPSGITAAAGATRDVGTLTLNTLSSIVADEFVSIATISFTRDGDVEENNVDQNPTVEYTDNQDTDIGDFCQCKMDHTGGSGGTPTIPTFSAGWSENTYITISTERTATVSRGTVGTNSSTGTAYVREAADVGNEVSATYTIRATRTPGTILL